MTPKENLVARRPPYDGVSDAYAALFRSKQAHNVDRSDDPTTAGLAKIVRSLEGVDRATPSCDWDDFYARVVLVEVGGTLAFGEW